jgi:hypothetical protein
VWVRLGYWCVFGQVIGVGWIGLLVWFRLGYWCVFG